MQRSFTINTKIWRWPGDMPWHFVNIDKSISSQIRTSFPSSSMVKVEAQIGEITWRTSLFRNNKDNSYLLPIKKDVRKKEGLYDGDMVSIKIEIL